MKQLAHTQPPLVRVNFGEDVINFGDLAQQLYIIQK